MIPPINEIKENVSFFDVSCGIGKNGENFRHFPVKNEENKTIKLTRFILNNTNLQILKIKKLKFIKKNARKNVRKKCEENDLKKREFEVCE